MEAIVIKQKEQFELDVTQVVGLQCIRIRQLDDFIYIDSASIPALIEALKQTMEDKTNHRH